MKKLIIALMGIVSWFNLLGQTKVAGAEIGLSAIRVTTYDVVNKETRSFTNVEFFEFPLAISQYLTAEKELSSSAISQISIAIESQLKLIKEKGVAPNNVFSYFSSSFDYLTKTNKLELQDEIETETGIKPKFLNSFKEGRSIALIAIPSDEYEVSSAYFLGSTSFKGGCIEEINSEYEYTGFDFDFGVRAIKNRFFKQQNFESLVSTFCKDSVGYQFDFAYSNMPNVMKKSKVYFCGDPGYFVALQLGAKPKEKEYPMTILQLQDLKKSSADKSFQVRNEIASKVDREFIYTACCFMLACMKQGKEYIINLEDRTPVLGSSLNDFCKRPWSSVPTLKWKKPGRIFLPGFRYT